MVRELVHDPLFLGRKSEFARADDVQIAQDLLDTVTFHKQNCVGMAANMIGELKRIIVFLNGTKFETMYNPEIIRCSGAYIAKEGCLSLLGGEREVKR